MWVIWIKFQRIHKIKFYFIVYWTQSILVINLLLCDSVLNSFVRRFYSRCAWCCCNKKNLVFFFMKMKFLLMHWLFHLNGATTSILYQKHNSTIHLLRVAVFESLLTCCLQIHKYILINLVPNHTNTYSRKASCWNHDWERAWVGMNEIYEQLAWFCIKWIETSK